MSGPMSASGSSSNGARGKPASPRVKDAQPSVLSGSFEEVDDDSEMLAKFVPQPLARPPEPSSSSGSGGQRATAASASASTAESRAARRALLATRVAPSLMPPESFESAPGAAATGSKRSFEPDPSVSGSEALKRVRLAAAGIAAPSLPSNGSASAQHHGAGGRASNPMVIGGSGARVPTQLLDQSGGYPQRAPQPQPPMQPVASGSGSSNGAHAMYQKPKPEPVDRKPRVELPPSQAIDLTAGDSDDEVQMTGQRTKAKAEPEIQVDERKNQTPVCLGVVNGMVLCMYGLPGTLKYAGDSKPEDAPRDPAFERENWPGGISHFWSQRGYGPILLSMQPKANVKPGSAPGVQNLDISVHSVIPPAIVNRRMQRDAMLRGRPPPPLGVTSQQDHAFGTLVEKYKRGLLPLITSHAIRCEARCRLAPESRGALFLHAIEILIFTTTDRVGFVTSTLAAEGVALEPPVLYQPADYPGQPRLIVQAPPPGAHANQLGWSSNAPHPRPYIPVMYNGGSASGQLMQSKEQTEAERKKQVDSVYSSLRSGEDLVEVEPNAVITTPMFPHQKQALAFLIDREKERTFEYPNGVPAPAAKGKGKAIKEAAEVPDVSYDEDTVSLWRPKKDSQGRVRSYLNIVTNQEQQRHPEICRGAILADDMGLGKTITTISLIAHTWNEAIAFGKTKPSSPNAVGMGGKDDDDDEGFEMMNLPNAPAGKGKGKGAGKAKAQEKKNEAERVRRRHLEVRSRATLIVLPLTLVSSWDEQFKEHWNRRHLPKMLVYHGPNRSSEAEWIADHDIVLTTYSTLANEFARQKTWISDGGDGDGDAPPPPESDDEMEVTEARGPGLATLKPVKKRAKKAKSADSKNPLQRIEWFRIVLDEAHTIKEARTWQSKAVCNLSAQRRLALTGTPVQNRMDDLFALIKFVRLEPFNDRVIWNEYCGGNASRGGGLRAKKEKVEVLDDLALRRVQVIMKFLTLRRSKDGKLKNGRRLLDLPAKFARTMALEFSSHERAVYTDLHHHFKEEFEMMKAADTLKSNYATILHEISNLRMVCDHQELVEDSKDQKRQKGSGIAAGLGGVMQAIKEDGLTASRAKAFFQFLAGEEQARCSLCGVDLTHADIDDEGAAEPKPIVTRCLHTFCAPCFRKAPGVKWPLKNAKGDDRMRCPDCNETIETLVGVVQLQPRDVDAAAEAADEGGDADAPKRKRVTFGSDAHTPIEERADLSTKIRALLADITPFSQCNPSSLLFDSGAPVLDHYEVPREKGKPAPPEPVTVIQHPSRRDGGPDVTPIKSVVFSQWTKMLNRVGQALDRAGIKSVRLDGTMKRDDRAKNIEQFKTDEATEVLLISLKVGGTGLNLVQACRAYLLEPYWNPATENQGLDRIHRLGQLRPVITTKFVVSKTIEERMLALQAHKLELAKSVGDHSERRKGGDIAMLLADGRLD